jgi:NAD(P)-dependent dehydrogenase (short-subunit alcohol dehydrogenase family)
MEMATFEDGARRTSETTVIGMAKIFITGSMNGLGLAAARSLLSQGHHVVLHARSLARTSTVSDLMSLSAKVVIGDLSDAGETRAVADQLNAVGRMNAVIHNAGVYGQRTRESTAEGHATILAVNTLAPYVLTALIERPDRLIYLSSGLHRGGEGSLRDIDWTTRPWDTGRAYAESKLYVAALAIGLARRWPEVLTNVVDPGWVRTRMGGQGAPVDLDTGQRTQAWLAVSNEAAARVSGGYWHHMRQEQPASQVTEPTFQEELIAKLGELTGVWLP